MLLEVGLWRAAIGYENWDLMTPADEIQQSLEEHARQRLPHYMGQAYTDLVVACLQGKFVRDGRAWAALIMSDIERERILLAYYEAVVSGIEGGTVFEIIPPPFARNARPCWEVHFFGVSKTN